MNTAPATPHRRRIPGSLLVAALITLLFLVIAAALCDAFVDGLPELPWPVVVNGHDLTQTLRLTSMDEGQRLLLGVALALLATIILVLVPLSLVLAALMAFVLPLLAIVMVLLLMLSPLLAVAGLLWWLLRPSRPAGAAR